VLVAEHEGEQLAQVVQVLAGVEQSTIWVASGKCWPARFQIQTAPSPRMVSWRTWPAPRRRPSAAIKVPDPAAGAKVAR
jgi:hypothetical protein